MSDLLEEVDDGNPVLTLWARVSGFDENDENQPPKIDAGYCLEVTGGLPLQLVDVLLPNNPDSDALLVTTFVIHFVLQTIMEKLQTEEYRMILRSDCC